MTRIRLAVVQDASALVDILKQYIETPITLDYEVGAVIEKESQILAISHQYPFLAIENDDEVIGFAYAHRNLETPALSWNAELRAFISLSQRGYGYGFKAMEVLIEFLKLQNVQNVYSNVTEGNPRSDSLHKKLGFNSCGTLHKTGYKNGRWLDVNLYEKCISDEGLENEPLPFIPFNKIPKDRLQKIFDKVNAQLASD